MGTSVYVARHSRGKHFNGLSSHTGGKGGGGGGSNTAPSCYMLYGNLVTLRVGHLGLKWVLTLFILLPFIKTIAVKYRVRYIPRSKLFSLRGTGSMTSHIMWQ